MRNLINLNVEKKTMLELRIKRRLKSLELASFSEYCDISSIIRDKRKR